MAFAINFVLMLYLTFFFLRDGHSLIELMIRALPLGDTRVSDTCSTSLPKWPVRSSKEPRRRLGSRNTGRPHFLGPGDWWRYALGSGNGHTLPPLRSAQHWCGGLAIYLFATGDAFKGAVLAGFGMFVIGMVDNILRPILVGRDTKNAGLHGAALNPGGIGLFGLNGFVIGPVLAALFLAFWQILA